MSYILPSYLLCFMRASGFLLVLPFGNFIKHRIPLALLLTFLFYDGVKSSSVGSFDFGSEVMLGIVIGLPVCLLMYLPRMLGNLMEIGRGQNVPALLNPLIGGTSTSLGSLLESYYFTTFILSGSLLALIQLFGRSLRLIPLGDSSWTWLNTFPITIHLLITHEMLGVLSFFLSLAMVFLLVDIGGAFIGKYLPKISLQQEVFQLKSSFAFLSLMQIFDFEASEAGSKIFSGVLLGIFR